MDIFRFFVLVALLVGCSARRYVSIQDKSLELENAWQKYLVLLLLLLFKPFHRVYMQENQKHGPM